jgi:hypothetical protein
MSYLFENEQQMVADITDRFDAESLSEGTFAG